MAINVPRDCRDLIDAQHGMLARRQVAQVGLATAAIDDLLRSGRWERVYLGTYASHTGKLSRMGVLWAAVLRCGPDAVLSHLTAAELDGIRGRRTETIHVTVPHRQRVRFATSELTSGLPRIVVHRSDRIAAACHPVRIPPRTRIEETVLDLVDQSPDFDTAFSWLTAACAGRLVLPEHLRAAAASRARLRWRADARIALDDIAEGVHSHLERRFYRRVELPHRLPAPRRQRRWRQRTRTAYLDMGFDQFGVVVEADGAIWHPVEDRWQDIHRDNGLARDGILTLRYSWADITDRPCEVAAEIAGALRSGGWTGRVRGCGPTCPAAAS